MVWAELIGPARDQDSEEMVPDWRRADMESLKKSLSEINWEEKFNEKTGIESWDIFKSILKEETDRCVPKKKRRTSSTSLDEQKCAKINSQEKKDVEVVHEGGWQRF